MPTDKTDITLSKAYAVPSATKLKVTELKVRMTAIKLADDGTPVGPPYTFEAEGMNDQALFDSTLAAARLAAPEAFPT